ncbi:MAG TPA: amino acid permease [Pyrinomonadaceae bacterium]|nr:amino acid permease [Pyrinomonadaceae bacterium]
MKKSETLARRLTLFDATMIVMGGIIGAGIFSNPYVVAQLVHSTSLILGVWIAGGLIALAGAFIYAELSSQVSETGGQYVYLRDAMHPVVGFVYGWSMLFVIQTGAMAAVALIFANHVFAVAGVPASDWSAALLAASALILLTIVNCIGVRAGTLTQNTFMILKLVAIAALVVIGLALATPASAEVSAVAPGGSTWQALIAFGAALIPAQFAYGGWQTSCYVAGEVREPRRTLPRALLIGVVGVIIVYLSVNFVCVYVLGPEMLARTKTPASAIMGLALGDKGARFIAAGIAISTIGFLSQSMLTAPRVYFAMAEDGLFFKRLASLNRSRVPAFAIALQGGLAAAIALVGSRYEQILNYAVSVDVVSFGMTAACVFVFRRARNRAVIGSPSPHAERGIGGEVGDGSNPAPNPSPRAGRGEPAPAHGKVFRIPGHPFTTLFFIGACAVITFSMIYKYPRNSAISFGIMFLGVPAYFLWTRRRVSTGTGSDRIN